MHIGMHMNLFKTIFSRGTWTCLGTARLYRESFEFSFGDLSRDGASRADFLDISLSLRESGGWGPRPALGRGGSVVRRANDETVSSLDNERTVCLSSSDPNVLRVKITKPNIVGIYLYTVFVSVVFCARLSVQYVVVTVVRVIWAGGGSSGWS